MKPQRYEWTPNHFGRFLCAVGIHAKRKQTFVYEEGTIPMPDKQPSPRVNWLWYRCARCKKII